MVFAKPYSVRRKAKRKIHSLHGDTHNNIILSLFYRIYNLRNGRAAREFHCTAPQRPETIPIYVFNIQYSPVILSIISYFILSSDFIA